MQANPCAVAEHFPPVLSCFFPLPYFLPKTCGPNIFKHLSGSVTTIDDDIGASGVGACVGGKVDVGALELGGLGVTAKRDHAVPQLLDVLGHEVRQTSVDVAWRDGVDACKVAPFIG